MSNDFFSAGAWARLVYEVSPHYHQLRQRAQRPEDVMRLFSPCLQGAAHRDWLNGWQREDEALERERMQFCGKDKDTEE